MNLPGGPMVKGVGTVVGGVTGTLVGAMAPENTLDALEMMGVLEPGSRDRMGLSDDQMKTLLLGEASLDLFFMGGVAAARGVGRGVSNILTGANATSKGLAEVATREGIALLPVQVGEGAFARGYVSVMGRLPIIAGPIKKGATRSLDQIGRMFEGIPQRLGPLASMDEVSGNIMRDAHYTMDGVARHFETQANQLMARADNIGIKILPRTTRSTTDNLIRQLDKEASTGFGGQAIPADAPSRDLRAFINSHMRPMNEIDPATGRSGLEMGQFSLRQVDNLIGQVGRKIAFWAAKGETQVMQRYEQLYESLRADSLIGMVRGRNAAGEAILTTTDESRGLMNQFRNMDEDQAYTMATFFQTTTARRLGITTSVTGRAAQMAELGTRGMDKMGEVVLRGDSPEAVAELARLTSPNTMRQLSNAVFNKALEEAYIDTSKAGVRMFSIEAFEKSLGLSAPTSSKYRQTAALLEASGGMSIDQLRTFAQITRRASEVEVPNVSSFLARKMTLGGMESITKALPGATMMGAATGGGAAAGGLLTGLVAGVTTAGGLRLVASIISNPNSSRALSRVMDIEARGVVGKAVNTRAVVGGFLTAVRYGVNELVKDKHIPRNEAEKLVYDLSLYANRLEKDLKRNAP